MKPCPVCAATPETAFGAGALVANPFCEAFTEDGEPCIGLVSHMTPLVQELWRGHIHFMTCDGCHEPMVRRFYQEVLAA